MEILYLIIGLGLGAIVGFFMGQKKDQESRNFTENKLNRELAEERAKRIGADARAEGLKESLEKSTIQLKEAFDALAAKAINNNSKAFMNLAEQTLSKYVSKANDDYTQQQLAIKQLVNPLSESLNKHETLIKKLDVSNSRLFGQLQTNLEQLDRSQRSLEKETGALVSALKSPKVRGRWGEIGLKRIVEFSGMSAYCDFDEQMVSSKADSKIRPDMLVHLPGNAHIVVDSKVPLNAYLEALEATDDKDRDLMMQQHARAVHGHLKDLSSKAYWSQFENSIDFVVLYLEVESAFGAALQYNKELIAEGLKNRIVFATPTTLIALLQTVAFTWKQHTATENVLAIWKSSKELFERIATFTAHLDKMGNSLNAATKSYNQAVGSWTGRVLPGIRRMEELGVSSDMKQISDLEQIDTQARSIKD